MTTIAYRNGVLASDSRLTLDEQICTDKCKKIWRMPDGSLFGASGDNEPGLLIFNAVKKGLPLPPVPADAEVFAIRIAPKGQIFITEGRIWERWPEKFVAIGSGGKYARAAMLNGADAITAVKIGISMDVYSGGRVQTLRLRRK